MLLDIYDPKAPPRAIGIDLGTTNSIVAYVRDERPTALVNCDGTQLLPSVVHYGEHGQVQVGRTAQSYLTREPERTIAPVPAAAAQDAGAYPAAVSSESAEPEPDPTRAPDPDDSPDPSPSAGVIPIGGTDGGSLVLGAFAESKAAAPLTLAVIGMIAIVISEIRYGKDPEWNPGRRTTDLRQQFDSLKD